MSECPSNHSDANLSFGILLILGSVISFIPQYYKIIKTKSVEGISHWSQGLNNMSSFCAFFGAFMLDYHLFRCCKENGACGYILLPFIQLFFNWLCPLINYLIYIKYFVGKDMYETRNVYRFFGFYVVVFLISFTMTTIVLAANWYSWQEHAILFGAILNMTSTIVTSFVWIPQIIKTYQDKGIGSLSLLSLAIQAPGSFLIFIFQVVLSKSSWYIGFPYLVSSLFQTIILIMGFVYERTKKHHRTIYSAYYDKRMILKNPFDLDDDDNDVEDAQLLDLSKKNAYYGV